MGRRRGYGGHPKVPRPGVEVEAHKAAAACTSFPCLTLKRQLVLPFATLSFVRCGVAGVGVLGSEGCRDTRRQHQRCGRHLSAQAYQRAGYERHTAQPRSRAISTHAATPGPPAAWLCAAEAAPPHEACWARFGPQDTSHRLSQLPTEALLLNNSLPLISTPSACTPCNVGRDPPVTGPGPARR